jgi:hypothetical protein
MELLFIEIRAVVAEGKHIVARDVGAADQGSPAHEARETVEIVKGQTVSVSTKNETCVKFFKDIRHFKPIIESITQGIVSEGYDRFAHCVGVAEGLPYPLDVFFPDMPVSHFEEGTGVETYKEVFAG